MLEYVLSFSIRHRWLVVLITVAAAAIGVGSLQRLPIDAVPDATGVQVVVTTALSGLDPEETEKQITFPIESALAGTPGLTRTRSLSRNGFSQVTADFEEGTDIYFARQQVSERLVEAKEMLPPGTEPRLGSVSTGLSNVYLWALELEPPGGHADGEPATAAVSDTKPISPPSAGDPAEQNPGWQSDGSYLTPDGESLRTESDRLTYLRTVQDWIVKPQIKQVKNVADVDVLGGFVKQYVVEPRPAKLVQYGITIADLLSALDRNNRSAGGSYIERRGEAALVRINARARDVDEIASIPLRSTNGTPLLVMDVAEVRIGHDVRSGAASLNGHEVVSGIAMMLTGANSRTVAADVDTRLKAINLPPGVRITTVLNRERLVDSTIRTVSSNLIEGAILVVVVLLLLLGNLRAALLTALAIPLSMLLTSVGMVASKVSGNLMSLGAIDFGLIVDGAVIIVENCLRMLALRQRELGRTLTTPERLETVLVASKQVRSATAFGEAIIIIVYLPILTLAGVEGRMFRPMAITVVLALAAAFVLSLTFVPAMVAILVRGRVRETENPIVHLASRAYGPILRLALRMRLAVVVVAFLMIVGAACWFTTLGRVFVPRLDEGDVNVITTRIPSTSLSEAILMQRQIERVLLRMPEVRNVLSITGTGDAAQDPIPQFEADTFATLQTPDKWRSEAELDAATAALEKRLKSDGILKDAPAAALSEDDEDGDADRALDHKGKLVKLMKLEIAVVPGTGYEMSQPIEDRFNEMIAGVRSDVAIEVYGEKFDQMRPAAERVAAVLRRVPGAVDVKVEATEGLSVIDIVPDRQAIARVGLAVADVTDFVDVAVAGRKAGVIFEGDRRFDLVVRLPEALRNDVDAIAQLPISLPKLPDPAVASRLPRPQSVTDQPNVLTVSALARFHIEDQQYEVIRQNGKRHVVVQCNVRGRDLGSFVDDARRQVTRDVQIPAGNWIEWGGQFETYAAARHRLVIVVPIALFLIFTLLFASFGSVRDALLVFSGVPLALTGGVAALALRGMPFSISAGVGFIALSGVAVLNGLVMVSFIRQLLADGVPLNDAVYQGCMTRLRPVMMTATVAAIGFLPMAIATGSGAEVQRPLATVVIGGIVSCTLLTLVVLPALYKIVGTRQAAEGIV
ncbi:efflux RND transporter permease subunit [Humisphaera borealis]|uniref:CusA/CzcA family heavy metal efflux RND transporter n=1 Tax=Humisphaera borealis TaxID=2807512 RepID=A0A7M2WW38_9BACT|nr:CusA/CzcA family heavy metal efflux RND transporter [Humisphaera borealis]QOV89767.1 CusA/CzcA family heavy metal efflux RND transporter [Humisphaera borealis]